jgi:DNA polymerase
MKSFDPKLIASFIEQRMEMGETEWFFKPDITVFRSGRLAKQHHAVYNDTGEKTPYPESGKMVFSTEGGKECKLSAVSDESIAAGENLDELYKTVCGCLRCPLGKLRKNFVFGVGNPRADIMFIGEAPGADEDAQGIPFVGRAGQLLTRMIEAIKLTREEVYIGNILKCRPPGNRDPRADEIEMCEPILIRQIEIIRPRIICALGRIAGQTLLRTQATLALLRNKIHDYHGVKLVVTYHPAALLRNQKWKPNAWEDLKFLRREYDGMEIP